MSKKDPTSNNLVQAMLQNLSEASQILENPRDEIDRVSGMAQVQVLSHILLDFGRIDLNERTGEYELVLENGVAIAEKDVHDVHSKI